MVGCGSIGQAVLPLLVRDLGVRPDRITVVTADGRGRDIAAALGVALRRGAADARELPRRARAPASARRLPAQPLRRGVRAWSCCAFASRAGRPLPRHRHRAVARRLHRPQPQPGRALQPGVSRAGRWPCARELGPGTPTAVICQGANPGLVSQLVKAGGLELARAVGLEPDEPPRRPRAGRGCSATWASGRSRSPSTTARSAGTPKAAGEFVSTWSVDGFLGEGSQPAELGWGTARGCRCRRTAGAARGRRARHLPAAAGRRRARAQLVAGRRAVRRLPDHPHGIALDRRPPDPARGRAAIVYRPDRALRLPPLPRFGAVACTSWSAAASTPQPRQRILGAGHRQRPGRARRAAGRASARRLLVRLAAVDRRGARDRAARQRHRAPGRGRASWAAWPRRSARPALGLVEPEELDFRARARRPPAPTSGRVVGAWSDWTPLTGRGRLFPEALDRSDPWRFANVRVA